MGTGLFALVGLLGRWSDGSALVPPALAVALQLPLVFVWFVQRGRRQPADERTASPAAPPSRAVPWLAIVSIVAIGGAILRNSPSFALTAITMMALADTGVDLAQAWIARLRAAADDFRRLCRLAVTGWVVAILLGTLLLAVPIGTHSAVPDYRHNFWRHVSFCAYTATSATCLVGTSGYEIGSDLSPFGQCVVYALMQFGGVGVAALGLLAARQMLGLSIRLRWVLGASWLIQFAGAAVLFSRWRDADAPTMLARAGWSLFHSAAGFLNCGFSLRPDGLALYLLSAPVFVTMTTLFIVGSTGPATFVAMLRLGRADDTVSELPEPMARLRRTLQREFGATFWLLVVGAAVVFLCETPGAMPAALVPARPIDVGANQVPLAELSGWVRWRGAVYLVASARSAGGVGLPLAQGAINWATLATLFCLMTVGGSLASFAGGLRTTTLLTLASLGLRRKPPTDAQADERRGGTPAISPEDELRHRVVRPLAAMTLMMLALCLVSIGILALAQQATTWEILLEGWATACGVGWSAGLTPHLTWPARVSMIIIMCVGRLLPLLVWCRVAAALDAPAPPVARAATRA